MANPTIDAPERGTGSVTDPVRGENGSCAYRGCDKVGGFVRVTEDGHFVSYCQTHEAEADRLFSQTKLDA